MSTAVIVTYQSSGVIEACLRSLAGMRVIVVDNASTDGTAAIVRRGFPDVQLVQRSHNGGLAVAVNEGLRHAGDDDVLLLNPDTVVQPNAIAVLERYLATCPRAAIVAPRLLNPDGSVQESIRTFPTPLTMAARRSLFGSSLLGRQIASRHLLRLRSDDEAGPIPWALGAAILIRRSAIEAVGGMDEWFFLYNEDIDWCYRMWHAGWEVHYVPQADVMHAYQRASTGRLLDREPATRHHWVSVIKLFVRHPVMLVGSSPPGLNDGRPEWLPSHADEPGRSLRDTVTLPQRMLASGIRAKSRAGR